MMLALVTHVRKAQTVTPTQSMARPSVPVLWVMLAQPVTKMLTNALWVSDGFFKKKKTPE